MTAEFPIIHRELSSITTKTETNTADMASMNTTLATEFPAVRREISDVRREISSTAAKTETNTDDIASIKATLEAEFPAIRREISHMATKADVNALGLKLVVWNIGTIITLAGIVLAALRYIR